MTDLRKPGGTDRIASRKASENAIRAVSDRLSLQKAAFQKRPTAGRNPLPDLAGSFDAALRRLRKEPAGRAAAAPSRSTLAPPSMKFPEPAPVEVPKEVATPSGETPTVGPPRIPAPEPAPVRARTAPAAVVGDQDHAGMTSTREVVGSAGPSTGASGEGDPGRRIAWPVHPDRGFERPASHPDAPASTSGPGPTIAPIAGRPAPGSADPPPSVRLPGAFASPGTDRFESTGDQGSGSADAAGSARVGGPGRVPADPARPDPVPRVESARVAVAGPIGSSVRNLAMATSEIPGSGRIDANLGPDGSGNGIGTGPVDRGFGETTGASAGGSLDLSKTNELLQQLVDAVRRQGASPLPAGGPPVYPGR